MLSAKEKERCVHVLEPMLILGWLGWFALGDCAWPVKALWRSVLGDRQEFKDSVTTSHGVNCARSFRCPQHEHSLPSALYGCTRCEDLVEEG